MSQEVSSHSPEQIFKLAEEYKEIAKNGKCYIRAFEGKESPFTALSKLKFFALKILALFLGNRGSGEYDLAVQAKKFVPKNAKIAPPASDQTGLQAYLQTKCPWRSDLAKASGLASKYKDVEDFFRYFEHSLEAAGVEDPGVHTLHEAYGRDFINAIAGRFLDECLHAGDVEVRYSIKAGRLCLGEHDVIKELSALLNKAVTEAAIKNTQVAKKAVIEKIAEAVLVRAGGDINTCVQESLLAWNPRATSLKEHLKSVKHALSSLGFKAKENKEKMQNLFNLDQFLQKMATCTIGLEGEEITFGGRPLSDIATALSPYMKDQPEPVPAVIKKILGNKEIASAIAAALAKRWDGTKSVEVNIASLKEALPKGDTYARECTTIIAETWNVEPRRTHVKDWAKKLLLDSPLDRAGLIGTMGAVLMDKEKTENLSKELLKDVEVLDACVKRITNGALVEAGQSGATFNGLSVDDIAKTLGVPSDNVWGSSSLLELVRARGTWVFEGGEVRFATTKQPLASLKLHEALLSSLREDKEKQPEIDAMLTRALTSWKPGPNGELFSEFRKNVEVAFQEALGGEATAWHDKVDAILKKDNYWEKLFVEAATTAGVTFDGKEVGVGKATLAEFAKGLQPGQTVADPDTELLRIWFTEQLTEASKGLLKGSDTFSARALAVWGKFLGGNGQLATPANIREAFEQACTVVATALVQTQVRTVAEGLAKTTPTLVEYTLIEEGKERGLRQMIHFGGKAFEAIVTEVAAKNCPPHLVQDRRGSWRSHVDQKLEEAVRALQKPPSLSLVLNLAILRWQGLFAEAAKRHQAALGSGAAPKGTTEQLENGLQQAREEVLHECTWFLQIHGSLLSNEERAKVVAIAQDGIKLFLEQLPPSAKKAVAARCAHRAVEDIHAQVAVLQSTLSERTEGRKDEDAWQIVLQLVDGLGRCEMARKIAGEQDKEKMDKDLQGLQKALEELKNRPRQRTEIRVGKRSHLNYTHGENSWIRIGNAPQGTENRSLTCQRPCSLPKRIFKATLPGLLAAGLGVYMQSPCLISAGVSMATSNATAEGVRTAGNWLGLDPQLTAIAGSLAAAVASSQLTSRIAYYLQDVQWLSSPSAPKQGSQAPSTTSGTVDRVSAKATTVFRNTTSTNTNTTSAATIPTNTTSPTFTTGPAATTSPIPPTFPTFTTGSDRLSGNATATAGRSTNGTSTCPNTTPGLNTTMGLNATLAAANSTTTVKANVTESTATAGEAGHTFVRWMEDFGPTAAATAKEFLLQLVFARLLGGGATTTTPTVSGGSLPTQQASAGPGLEYAWSSLGTPQQQLIRTKA